MAARRKWAVRVVVAAMAHLDLLIVHFLALGRVGLLVSRRRLAAGCLTLGSRRLLHTDVVIPPWSNAMRCAIPAPHTAPVPSAAREGDDRHGLRGTSFGTTTRDELGLWLGGINITVPNYRAHLAGRHLASKLHARVAASPPMGALDRLTYGLTQSYVATPHHTLHSISVRLAD